MKKTLRNCASIAAMLSAGCASSHYTAHKIDSSAVAFPNGTQGYVIHCPGEGRDLSICENEATRLCGGLYGAVDTSGAPSADIKAIKGTLTVACVRP